MADPRNNEAHMPTISTPNKTLQTPKRNTRHKNQHHQSLPQTDGAVSDSVAYPSSTPQTKRTPKPRHQSVALNAQPHIQPHPAARAVQDHRQRPASHGGAMAPNTPLKEQAYAGPTFQASPAPSSLPVPKFFSRSVPNVAGQSSLAQRLEAERTPEKESSPEPDIVAPQIPDRANQQSPLDVFFKADRNERQKSRSGLSPELTRTHNVPVPQHPGGQQYSNGIFLHDGAGAGDALRSPPLPSVNAQFPSQRPMPTSHSGANATPSANTSETESDREAQSNALKALLFNSINNSSSSATHPQQAYTPPREPHNQYGPYHVYQTPSPSQRSVSGPSTPAPPGESYYPNPNFHYGNQRNLSPLFKAASGRNDSPANRPSGLRHQDFPPSFPSAPQSHHQPTVDARNFSRNFLEQHINGSGVGAIPISGGQGIASPPPYANGPGAPAATNQAHGSPFTKAPPNGNPNGPEAQDTKSMENDLRRMLNLNVVSN